MNKKIFLPALIFSIIFIIASIGIIIAGIYFLSVQKYNPIISIVIVAIGIINLFFGFNINKSKSWAYYSLIIYFISAAVILCVNDINLIIKIPLIVLSLLLVHIFIKSSRMKEFFNIDHLDGYKEVFSDAYKFTKEDSKASWAMVISFILILMQFALFPLLTLLTGSTLPIVIVESCSMYHEADFNTWWERNSAWYENNDITKSEFSDFPFLSGLNKGDIVFVQKSKEYEKGDIIIFKAPTAHPIIHRLVSLDPLQTKGDHNLGQIEAIEKDIPQSDVIGKAVFRIPLLGWIKLIFFEPFQNEGNKGFCN